MKMSKLIIKMYNMRFIRAWLVSFIGNGTVVNANDFFQEVLYIGGFRHLYGVVFGLVALAKDGTRGVV